MSYSSLNQEKALIWRIVHRANLPWILDHGLHCGNGLRQSPDWVSIGNPDLTEKRGRHAVPIAPFGYLNDYVPFYFTPFSVMMKNIHSGWAGIQRRSNDEILILVSSLHRMSELGLPFVFTDSHAYYQWANYYRDLDDLQHIDWPLLQQRDFKRDADDPAKIERYQAEALIYQHCPVDALLGIMCYTPALQQSIAQQIQLRGLELKVHARPGWYF